MIIRGPRPSDAITLIHTSALADGALSFKARGILAYLLTLPEGTDISPDRITKSGTDGERAVTSGLKELEDAGYLIRTPSPEGTVDLGVTDTPGVGASTPVEVLVPRDVVQGADHLMWLVGQHPWLSPAALRTAHREIHLQELPLALTKYEIRMKELGKTPSNSEWLRWLIADEEKLIGAERAAAREAGHHKPWWATA
jgi:hypothetical protein